MFSPEELAHAQSVLDSVKEEWLLRPGVTAVDLGFKWTGDMMTGQLAIRVHVVEKKPLPAPLRQKLKRKSLLVKHHFGLQYRETHNQLFFKSKSQLTFSCCLM